MVLPVEQSPDRQVGEGERPAQLIPGQRAWSGAEHVEERVDARPFTEDELASAITLTPAPEAANTPTATQQGCNVRFMAHIPKQGLMVGSPAAGVNAASQSCPELGF